MEANNHSHDLKRARTYAHLSWISMILPIIGWVFIGLSRSILADLPKSPMKKRLNDMTMLTLQISLVVLCVQIFALAFSVRSAVRRVKTTNAVIQNEIKAETESNAQIKDEESIRRTNLTFCIDEVRRWYDANSQGTHPKDYWDMLNESRSQQVEECEIKFGS